MWIHVPCVRFGVVGMALVAVTRDDLDGGFNRLLQRLGRG